MKNVLLFAMDEKIVDAILVFTDWTIPVLVFSDDMYKERYMDEERIQCIYTRYDFHRNEDLAGLNFKTLEEFFDTQLRAESFFLRFINDYQMAKSDYYRGFSLVNRIFSDNHIDMVIVDGLNEGRTSDLLLAEFAKKRQIPSYTLDSMYSGKACIYDNRAEDMISLRREERISMDGTMFYDVKYSKLVDSVVFYHPILRNPIVKNIENVVYTLFGQVGVDACSCLYTMSNRKNKMGLKFSERFSLFYQAGKTARWLRKNTIKPNLQKKFIYFSLHYEPEASVSGRGLMDSQLIAIRMLSQVLPDDWYIYVKEHPHQLRYNERIGYGYPWATFKTKRFYEEITQLRNTVLVDTESPSVELIENCQVVASLSGTVCSEAIMAKKPIMVFAPQRTLYRWLSEAHNIFSYDDCLKAINMILQGYERGEKPCYKEWDSLCQEYLFDTNATGYREAVLTLEQL
jgi:hypothetical protein hcinC1_07800